MHGYISTGNPPSTRKRYMRISRLWCSVPVLLGMCLTPWIFLSAHTQHKAVLQAENEEQSSSEPGAGQPVAGAESKASEIQDSEANRPCFRRQGKQHNQEETGPRPASIDDTVPSGLVVVRHVNNSPQQDRALVEHALKNPFISGVGFQIHWSDIEPVQGKPDWSKLDELFAAAESSRKWVQLCIYPGFFAPAWALEGVKTEQFPIQYGPDKGTVLSLPMPWNALYLTRWFRFLKQLSDRYGESPALRMVAADGPTSVSEEMTLPRNVKKWRNASYTPSKYIGAWRKVFPGLRRLLS